MHACMLACIHTHTIVCTDTHAYIYTYRQTDIPDRQTYTIHTDRLESVQCLSTGEENTCDCVQDAIWNNTCILIKYQLLRPWKHHCTFPLVQIKLHIKLILINLIHVLAVYIVWEIRVWFDSMWAYLDVWCFVHMINQGFYHDVGEFSDLGQSEAWIWVMWEVVVRQPRPGCEDKLYFFLKSDKILISFSKNVLIKFIIIFYYILWEYFCSLFWFFWPPGQHELKNDSWILNLRKEKLFQPSEYILLLTLSIHVLWRLYQPSECILHWLLMTIPPGFNHAQYNIESSSTILSWQPHLVSGWTDGQTDRQTDRQRDGRRQRQNPSAKLAEG